MRVYPRVYGGTAEEWMPKIADWGLSPRVRGNRGRVDAQDRRLGSIPACTGEPRPCATC